METIIISSQRYLDDAIVAEKIESEDYEVMISPVFEYDGMSLAVVLDGHHSFAAAREAGVNPVFIEVDRQFHDAVGGMESGLLSPEDFLNTTYQGDYWYNINTGHDVW